MRVSVYMCECVYVWVYARVCILRVSDIFPPVLTHPRRGEAMWGFIQATVNDNTLHMQFVNVSGLVVYEMFVDN